MRQEKVATEIQELEKQKEEKEKIIMPYSKKRYGTRAKYKKYQSCVRKVKAKDKRVKSPHAICRTAIYGKKKKKR